MIMALNLLHNHNHYPNNMMNEEVCVKTLIFKMHKHLEKMKMIPLKNLHG